MPRGVRKTPKAPKEPRWQTHVYLSEEDFKLLAAVSERESRSTTMQIQHFIREGLERYRAASPKHVGKEG